jgi:hypothetical protein
MTADELRGVLEDAILRGDHEAIAAAIERTDEPTRRAAGAARFYPTRRGPFPDLEAVHRHTEGIGLAHLGTLSARELDPRWFHAFPVAYVSRVLTARGARFTADIARRWVGGPWAPLRRLVADGLVPEPTDDAYVRAMVEFFAYQADAAAIVARVTAEPALVPLVWRIFEIDLGTIFHFRDDRWHDGAEPLTPAICSLVEAGALDRDGVLDADLRALARVGEPIPARWYQWLHEALQPTVAEIAERGADYLHLASSPVPQTAVLALRTLARTPEAVTTAALTPALGPVFLASHKGVVRDALALVDARAADGGDGADALLAAACTTFGNASADLQDRAMRLIERRVRKGGPGPQVRAAALGHLDIASPVIRDRVQALAGVSTADPPRSPLPAAPVTWPAPRVPVAGEWLLEAPRVTPVFGLDELIPLLARLLEGNGTALDCERAVDGIARLCGDRPPDFDILTSGLQQQLRRFPYWWGYQHPAGQLIAMLIHVWLGARPPTGCPNEGIVGNRIVEIAQRVAAGIGTRTAALPLVESGFTGPRSAPPADEPPYDLAQYRLRLAAAPPSIAFAIVPDESETHGYPRPWFRIQTLVGDDAPGSAKQLSVYAYGYDELAARWAALTCPSLPSLAFAAAANAAARPDPRETVDRAYPAHVLLEPALAPTAALDDVGWLAVACFLLGRRGIWRRTATEVVIATIDDGRFDPGALGAAIIRCLRGEHAHGARLTGSLAEAAAISDLHAAQVLRLLGVLAAAEHPAPTATVSAWLGLAAELSAGLGATPFDEATRRGLGDRIGAASASSQLARAGRRVLAAPMTSAGLSAAAGAAYALIGQSSAAQAS